MLKIYNTLTKQKESFHPLEANTIRIYVCGMTVYDYCHIGHARVLVAFDAVIRYLRYQKINVIYVRNITDIDDKIIKRANENAESYTALTDRFITALHEDTAALGVLPPSSEPRATQHLAEMIRMIQTLINKGFAYVAGNGDVYYNVGQFKKYGQLAHQDLEKLQAGARVAVVDAKQGPLDFVLWKLAKPDEPHWDSPWGPGRPGWHIECSAMSTHCLGNHFDIHGGGFDLIFPHHENEIAQSVAATEQPFANTWMHVGFVQVEQEKMSKSLGNFFTIRDVLAKYAPEVVRYFLLASHYRSPLNYSTEALENSAHALERFYLTLRGLSLSSGYTPEIAEAFRERFNAAMDDDFNTPEALAILFDMVREINWLRDNNQLENASVLGATLRHLGGVLGILQQDPDAYLKSGEGIDQQQIEYLIAGRNQARANKQWAEADKLRDQLLAMGVTLEDTAQGTIWRKNS